MSTIHLIVLFQCMAETLTTHKTVTHMNIAYLMRSKTAQVQLICLSASSTMKACKMKFTVYLLSSFLVGYTPVSIKWKIWKKDWWYLSFGNVKINNIIFRIFSKSYFSSHKELFTLTKITDKLFKSRPFIFCLFAYT